MRRVAVPSPTGSLPRPSLDGAPRGMPYCHVTYTRYASSDNLIVSVHPWAGGREIKGEVELGRLIAWWFVIYLSNGAPGDGIRILADTPHAKYLKHSILYTSICIYTISFLNYGKYLQ